MVNSGFVVFKQSWPDGDTRIYGRVHDRKADIDRAERSIYFYTLSIKID